MTLLYQTTAVVFFAVLTLTTSMMLEHLIEQLPANETDLHGRLNQQLLKWKRHFGIISDCIEKIDDYFGVILLCFLAKQLFNIIAFTYWLAREFKHSSGIYPKTSLIVYLAKTVAYVVLVALVSHRVKQKVQIKSNILMRNA